MSEQEAESTAPRRIGVRHRVKKTVSGEARPTQIAIIMGGKVKRYDLENETAELDFLLGRFPTKMRAAGEDDTLDGIVPHHIEWRELEKDEEFTAPEHLRMTKGKKRFEAQKIPAAYEGYKTGDKIASVLGGSGDRFCFAFSRRGEEINGSVYRIPGFRLKNARGEADKDADPEILAKLLSDEPNLFYQVTRRDRDMINLSQILKDRVAALSARKGAVQRLRQRSIGAVFCNKEGKYPEGNLEDSFDEQRANSAIVTALEREEQEQITLLTKAIQAIPVYTKVLEQIKGCGPLIAAPLIASIVDIRRFGTKEGFKAFCGAHVQRDGKFPRQRRERITPKDELENTLISEVTEAEEMSMEPKWNRSARQALYLLVDQFNRRPDSEWGQRLLQYKKHFRTQHPEVIEEGGKKRYSKGHIHKMAIWRAVTKFAEYLYREWWKLEGGKPQTTQPPKSQPPTSTQIEDGAPISPERVALEHTEQNGA